MGRELQDLTKQELLDLALELGLNLNQRLKKEEILIEVEAKLKEESLSPDHEANTVSQKKTEPNASGSPKNQQHPKFSKFK